MHYIYLRDRMIFYLGSYSVSEKSNFNLESADIMLENQLSI